MYNFTIFPNAKLIDGSPDDKRRVAPFATIGNAVTLDSFEAVVRLASESTVSFNQYTASDKCAPDQVHRHGDYFLTTNLIGLDIDDNITLTDALERLRTRGWKFGVYTSFNHQKSGVDKFRVVLELNGYISDPTTYRNTWEAIHSNFLGLDAQCKDVARLFFHSDPQTRQVYCEDGTVLEIVTVAAPRPTKFATPAARHTASATSIDGFETFTQRAKLPIEVRTWLAGIDEYGEPWAPKPGERSGQFYKLALLCKERGYEREWCDSKLGERLRTDENYIAMYGISKIKETLDQVFAQTSRYGMPALYSYADLSDPRMFVESWVRTNKVIINRQGILLSGENKWTPNKALHTISLDYNQQLAHFRTAQNQLSKGEQRKVAKLTDHQLTHAIIEYVEAQKVAFVNQLRTTIAHNGDKSLSEVKKFSEAVVGKVDPVVEAVFAHFMWHVKRKVFGRPVEHHIMPILSGIQGNGKSTAVAKLLKPLEDFKLTPKLPDLTDPRHFESFDLNFVAFCDEMEQVEKTNIEGLKRFITGEDQTAREMYTSTNVKWMQNCTAIGCTNKSLSTLIYDPTGMRRFFEINTDPHMPTNGAWTQLASIDYLKMWQQIDENIGGSECYIKPFKAEVEARQEDLRVPDPVESFLRETGALVVDPLHKKPVSRGDLFRDYKYYCAQNGYVPKSSAWFGAALKGKVEFERPRIEGKQVYCYMVGADYKPVFEE